MAQEAAGTQRLKCRNPSVPNKSEPMQPTSPAMATSADSGEVRVNPDGAGSGIEISCMDGEGVPIGEDSPRFSFNLTSTRFTVNPDKPLPKTVRGHLHAQSYASYRITV